MSRISMPFFLLAMYEHNGQPLEKHLKNMILTKFIRDQDRPYQTYNYYMLLEKEAQTREEVRNHI